MVWWISGLANSQRVIIDAALADEVRSGTVKWKLGLGGD